MAFTANLAVMTVNCSYLFCFCWRTQDGFEPRSEPETKNLLQRYTTNCSMVLLRAHAIKDNDPLEDLVR
jgi:hypothetical protein